MKATIEAAEHDAKAMLAISKSLSDNLVPLKAAGLPERIAEAIEATHAEVLRSSHLVASWVALQKHAERPAKRRHDGMGFEE